MTSLYVDEQGAVVSCQTHCVRIEYDGVLRAELPAINLERLIIVGGVQITTQAMKLLLQESIPTCFVSHRGEYRGQLMPATRKNAPLRLAQYRCHSAEAFRIDFSRAVIRGKIRNSYKLVLRQQRSHPHLDLGEEIEQLAGEMSAVQRCLSVSSMMGHEGTASRIYFGAFRKMLLHDLGFAGRNRRPPRDPLNAMLSLGYTLLLGEVMTAVEVTGMDPYVGYLHVLEYGRPSLVVDLMEEFRFLVDAMVLAMVNRGEVKPEDFSTTPEKGCLMEKELRKKYYAHFDERMRTEITIGEGQTTYRAVISRQVKGLGQVVQGAEECYRPFEAH